MEGISGWVDFLSIGALTVPNSLILVPWIQTDSLSVVGLVCCAAATVVSWLPTAENWSLALPIDRGDFGRTSLSPRVAIMSLFCR